MHRSTIHPSASKANCLDDSFQRSENPSKDTIEIYDTTLRDGTQCEGLSFTVADKLRICHSLDNFGIDIIEGGWPGSNPKDEEFFSQIQSLTLQHAKLAAFGSTCRSRIQPDEDSNIQALIQSNAPILTIFGKSSTLHVKDILRVSPEENLDMIARSCRYLAEHGRHVVYDAEHFFDGFSLDPIYAMETLHAACESGAQVVVLCDTNGGSLPWDVHKVVQRVHDSLPCRIGVHAHNDSDCAVANSLAAVLAGASHIQGTINGYGERCGNANLCSIIANIELKMRSHCIGLDKLRKLSQLSHFVSEIANIVPDDHAPYVGRSAFAHKGGVHVAAMRRNPDSYQHVEPSAVGNKSRVVVSELSGKSSVVAKTEEFGLQLPSGLEESILQSIKAQEAFGFSFESAEATIALYMLRRAPDYKPLFEVLDYHVDVGLRDQGSSYAEASVKVRIDEEIMHTIAEANGPVHSLDAALRKALQPRFPCIEHLHLVDYKVRILDGNQGTKAITRVLIDTSDDRSDWTTVGASSNIIEASFMALKDSLEYGLQIASKSQTLSK